MRPFSRVLGKKLFQFHQGQLGDGLDGVVAFGDRAVDVGPAQASEADLCDIGAEKWKKESDMDYCNRMILMRLFLRSLGLSAMRSS